jgi:hypothetical protein
MMLSKVTSRLSILGCLFAFALPLVGCGDTGGGMTPQGPEMGELERYMSEHPELMDDSDEEMGEMSEDEEAATAALDAALASEPAPEAE